MIHSVFRQVGGFIPPPDGCFMIKILMRSGSYKNDFYVSLNFFSNCSLTNTVQQPISIFFTSFCIHIAFWGTYHTFFFLKKTIEFQPHILRGLWKSFYCTFAETVSTKYHLKFCFGFDQEFKRYALNI